MWTTNDEQFLRIGFSFLDSEYQRQVSLRACRVYEHLRRFTWRSEIGNSPAAKAFKKGLLVAYVTQRKLADRMGIQGRMVRYALDELRRLGWIQTHRTRHSLLYVLGRRVRTRREGKTFTGEVFFADSIVERKVLEEKAKQPNRQNTAGHSGKILPTE